MSESGAEEIDNRESLKSLSIECDPKEKMGDAEDQTADVTPRSGKGQDSESSKEEDNTITPKNRKNKCSDQQREKKVGKRPRTNYKDPENSAKLNAALSMLINQEGDAQVMKDIKSVAKIFAVPYNTLRDNFLRFCALISNITRTIFTTIIHYLEQPQDK